MTDVHEMIPELFCCPEVLLNTNKLPLGDRQDGMGSVDDITVPPWLTYILYTYYSIS